MQAHNKASEWFDDIYKNNKETQENIPWARGAVNPLLASYLEEEKEHKGSALVIGCGLGDDAKALEIAGYEVTAIDVSQSALDLAKARFPESSIRFINKISLNMMQHLILFLKHLPYSLYLWSLERK